jgi:hypothetical protein
MLPIAAGGACASTQVAASDATVPLPTSFAYQSGGGTGERALTSFVQAAALPPVGAKKAVVLSCSHIFHAKCIANFERYVSQSSSVEKVTNCCEINVRLGY